MSEPVKNEPADEQLIEEICIDSLFHWRRLPPRPMTPEEIAAEQEEPQEELYFLGPPHPAVWIMLSVAMILFSGSIIAMLMGIASLVFALRLRKVMNSGDPETKEVAIPARFCRNRCLIFLLIGLFAALVSGLVGFAALMAKYRNFRL